MQERANLSAKLRYLGPQIADLGHHLFRLAREMVHRLDQREVHRTLISKQAAQRFHEPHERLRARAMQRRLHPPEMTVHRNAGRRFSADVVALDRRASAKPGGDFLRRNGARFVTHRSIVAMRSTIGNRAGANFLALVARRS